MSVQHLHLNGDANGSGGQGSSPPEKPNRGEGGEPPTRRRRINCRAACDTCRARKAACNGHRPSCSGCQKLKVNCQYVTTHAEQTRSMAKNDQIERLNSELEDYEAIFRFLRWAPLEEAEALLKLIRTNPDISVVLAVVRGISPQQLYNPPE